MIKGRFKSKTSGYTMKTKYLTEDERRKGRKYLYQFQSFNGLGFNFMGTTSVYLLAIHFGASNFQLGYISSVMFLTGIILVALPKLLEGRNLVKVQSSAWFFRGMIALLYLFLFLLKGESAILLILVVYTLFSASRMVGMAVWNALVKMVADPGGSGEVISQGSISNQSASVVARIVSAVVTSFTYFSGIAGILLLQVLGVIFNTAAVTRLKKIPCREKVEYTKGRNIFVILTDALKDRKRRVPLLIKWVVISLIVLNGLIIPFVRKEAGFGSNYVFLYSLAAAVAVILSGLVARTFADRIGSRPLLIGVSLLLALLFIMWGILPLSSVNRQVPSYWYYILGFFTNFFLFLDNILISRVVVNTMPDDESFGYNAMVNFVTAIFSAAAGGIGGLLINWGKYPTFVLFNNYSYLFLFGVLLSAIVALLGLALIDKGSLSGRETAAILFSFEGLRAYINIGKMKSARNSVKKRTVLLSISENEAPAATEELKRILASPLSASKGEVLKSLFRHPRPELLPEILREAGDFGSYHQLKAIFALGAYPEKEVELLLLKLMDSNDSAVRSNAAKSLGRIGNKNILVRVKKLAAEAVSPWDRINYLIALKNMDGGGRYLESLFTRGKGEGSFGQTWFSLVADVYDMKPSLAGIYQAERIKKGSGSAMFLGGARDTEPFYANNRKLDRWIGRNDWLSVINFCVDLLERYTASTEEKKSGNKIHEYIKVIGKAIMSCHPDGKVDISGDEALAVLYFTYQVLKGYGE